MAKRSKTRKQSGFKTRARRQTGRKFHYMTTTATYETNMNKIRNLFAVTAAKISNLIEAVIRSAKTAGRKAKAAAAVTIDTIRVGTFKVVTFSIGTALEVGARCRSLTSSLVSKFRKSAVASA